MTPRTPAASASRVVYSRMVSCSGSESEKGGSTHTLSPEWIPAGSTCSMMPPMTQRSPSYTASTSTSTAFSRNLSTSTGCSGDASTAVSIQEISVRRSYTMSMPRPPSTYEGRTTTG